MNVIKKSGVQELFSPEKLARSLEAANTSTKESIDIPSLLTQFQQIVAEKTKITTQQINIIVFGLLYSSGHLSTLTRYQSYEKGQLKYLEP